MLWDVVPATEGSWMTAHPTVDRIQKDGITFTNLEMAVTAPAMTVSDREREVGISTGMLASQSTASVFFELDSFPKAFVFQSRRGLVKCPLVAPEPSVPAGLFRGYPPPNMTLYGFSQEPLVSQNRLRVSQLLDFQCWMTLRESLTKADE
jgi:hypothetical protein